MLVEALSCRPIQILHDLRANFKLLIIRASWRHLARYLPIACSRCNLILFYQFVSSSVGSTPVYGNHNSVEEYESCESLLILDAIQRPVQLSVQWIASMVFVRAPYKLSSDDLGSRTCQSVPAPKDTILGQLKHTKFFSCDKNHHDK